MQILHIDLRSIDNDFVDLRYSGENLNAFEPRRLSIAEIQDVIDLVERDYTVSLPEDYAKTGRRLYDWLDGGDRTLSTLLNSQPAVLAIATGERLAHLPWEILHDGQGFLVARPRPVVPVRWQAMGAGDRLIWREEEVPNRPLQMLFMATSPAGVEPVLDFEAEEGRILEATEKQPLSLVVEESGCLEELANLLTSYDRDYFDVVHLNGHGQISEDGPRFITETETGDPFYASPDEIAGVFELHFPPLMFLSGCHTGESGRGARAGEVPSMAAALLEAGAEAVLGWGRPVRDVDGILAAETLYSKLAGAKTLPEALALTYRAMIKAEARDWHLLRLYVTGSLSQNLVTPMRTPGRSPALKPSMAERFLDAERKVKVPDRKSFVGRRRELQACLRALRDPERVGVLIYGMGGLGKSSLAARLCDRLQSFERVVLFGPLDEAELVSKLAQAIRQNSALQQQVQNPDEELKYRLRDLFEAVPSSFLIVLDDFEANLEPFESAGGKGFRLKASQRENPARVLKALLWAITQSGRGHKVVMTCRYDFEFDGLAGMYKQPLARLQQADLNKKCRQLDAFGEKSTIEVGLRERALRLADGNPRLLEWLSKVLCYPEELGQGSVAAVLDKLEAEPAELREQVLAAVLVQQMDAPMREMLGRAMVYELPVPRAAILEICEEGAEGLIGRAVALGLLEQSPDGGLRVPRVLGFDSVQPTKLRGRAAEVLYRLWWEEASMGSEARLFEIYRLAVGGEKEEITVIVMNRLCHEWHTKGCYRKVIQLCNTTLEISQDFSIFHPRFLNLSPACSRREAFRRS